MTTWTAFTTAPDRASAEALGAAVETLRPAPVGVGVSEIEDGSERWEVGGYFDERPDAVGLLLLAAAWGAAPFAVSKLPARDWVAHVRRELSPVHAGRFVVHGSHDPEAAPVPLIGLKIEAAMAFGTGHHATTQGCLLAMQTYARRAPRPRRMADIGCGTGVLAMGAAKLWKMRAVASDIDPVATATARANLAVNGVAPLVRVVTAAGFRHPSLRGPRFDLICANILAKPLKGLAGDMRARLRPGGALVLSGILTRQAPGVEAVYRAHGFKRAARLRIGEWTTLTLTLPA